MSWTAHILSDEQPWWFKPHSFLVAFFLRSSKSRGQIRVSRYSCEWPKTFPKRQLWLSFDCILKPKEDSQLIMSSYCKSYSFGPREYCFSNGLIQTVYATQQVDLSSVFYKGLSGLEDMSMVMNGSDSMQWEHGNIHIFQSQGFCSLASIKAEIRPGRRMSCE